MELQFSRKFLKLIFLVLATSFLTGCPSPEKVTLKNLTSVSIMYCKGWEVPSDRCLEIKPNQTVAIKGGLSQEFSVVGEVAKKYSMLRYPDKGCWVLINEDYKSLLLELSLNEAYQIHTSNMENDDCKFLLEPL